MDSFLESTLVHTDLSSFSQGLNVMLGHHLAFVVPVHLLVSGRHHLGFFLQSPTDLGLILVFGAVDPGFRLGQQEGFGRQRNLIVLRLHPGSEFFTKPLFDLRIFRSRTMLGFGSSLLAF